MESCSPFALETGHVISVKEGHVFVESFFQYNLLEEDDGLIFHLEIE